MTTCEQCGKPMEDILEYVEHILHECAGQTQEYKTKTMEHPAMSVLTSRCDTIERNRIHTEPR